MIVITDGEITEGARSLAVSSWPLRKQNRTVDGKVYSGIRIMAVSVGDNIDLQGLSQVITPPVDENVFLARDHDDMYNAMRKLAEESCQYASGMDVFVYPFIINPDV